jgi:hypothetical protein
VKICSKCKAEKARSEFGQNRRNPDGLHHHCKACRRRYTAATKDEQRARGRAYYARHREAQRERMRDYRAANREKVAARNAVRTALRNGTMTKLACEACGVNERTEAHHDSYTKERRLDVRWLCPACHAAEHEET